MSNLRIISGYDYCEGCHAADEIPVLIDNLRASSTIATALSLGIKEIIPVIDDSQALKLKKKGCCIAGESGGEKISGYDIGNSPVELIEYYQNNSFDRLVLKTSNLVPLLLRCGQSYICSSLKISALKQVLSGKQLLLIAAGGMYGISEDFGVAFGLAAALHNVDYDPAALHSFTRESRAAQHLIDLGYKKDIDFITGSDPCVSTPFFDGRTIKNIP